MLPTPSLADSFEQKFISLKTYSKNVVSAQDNYVWSFNSLGCYHAPLQSFNNNISHTANGYFRSRFFFGFGRGKARTPNYRSGRKSILSITYHTLLHQIYLVRLLLHLRSSRAAAKIFHSKSKFADIAWISSFA